VRKPQRAGCAQPIDSARSLPSRGTPFSGVSFASRSARCALARTRLVNTCVLLGRVPTCFLQKGYDNSHESSRQGDFRSKPPRPGMPCPTGPGPAGVSRKILNVSRRQHGSERGRFEASWSWKLHSWTRGAFSHLKRLQLIGKGPEGPGTHIRVDVKWRGRGQGNNRVGEGALLRHCFVPVYRA